MQLTKSSAMDPLSAIREEVFDHTNSEGWQNIVTGLGRHNSVKKIKVLYLANNLDYTV